MSPSVGERLIGDEALIQAVRVVARGEALLSPSVNRRLIAEFAPRTRELPQAPNLDVLTNREREVTALVAEGLSNDEIARRLFVSPATAKTHAPGPPGPSGLIRLPQPR